MNAEHSPSRMLVMTVLGADHPGIVDRLARVIRQHGGNWLESRMARLGGQFAGIVAARVPSAAVDALENDLNALGAEGLSIIVQPGVSAETPAPAESGQVRMAIQILSPDRPGILSELTSLLAERSANVEELSTRIVPAEFSGEPLFTAHLHLALASPDEVEALREAIQGLATDLALDLSFQDF